MNAIQTRQRRWSSRLNNMANNSATNPPVSSSIRPIVSGNGFDSYNYTNPTSECDILFAPGVIFRPLPFYDLIEELIKPAGLISDGQVAVIHSSTIRFRLTIEQADKLAMSNTKQVILRFCHYDTLAEQDDNFPQDASVSVNGINVALPPAISNPNKPNVPPRRPGQHVDITRQCKFCPFIDNLINIGWYVDQLDPMRSYVVTVIIAEKVGSDVLLDRIKARGLSDPETTKRLIVDSDNEVTTTNLQSSLVCPLGKMRMSLPCKSTSCQHILCFDALFYLQMNEKKASWTCPVCYKPAYYRDLMIDGFFMNILANAEPGVTEVTLNKDGSWAPVMKLEQPTSAKFPPPEVITISDDED